MRKIERVSWEPKTRRWLVGCACFAMGCTLFGCATPALRSKVDQQFLNKVAKDPFPSASEKGLLPKPNMAE